MLPWIPKQYLPSITTTPALWGCFCTIMLLGMCTCFSLHYFLHRWQLRVREILPLPSCQSILSSAWVNTNPVSAYSQQLPLPWELRWCCQIPDLSPSPMASVAMWDHDLTFLKQKLLQAGMLYSIAGNELLSSRSELLVECRFPDFKTSLGWHMGICNQGHHLIKENFVD